jgi:hypothetical protein
MMTGSADTMAAADILAQNSPSDVLNPTMNTFRGGIFVMVRLKAMAGAPRAWRSP